MGSVSDERWLWNSVLYSLDQRCLHMKAPASSLQLPSPGAEAARGSPALVARGGGGAGTALSFPAAFRGAGETKGGHEHPNWGHSGGGCLAGLLGARVHVRPRLMRVAGSWQQSARLALNWTR